MHSFPQEHRVLPPPKEFSRRARIKSLAEYGRLYKESVRSPQRFWARQGKEELVWVKPWTEGLQWKAPFAKWFIGGRVEVSHNLLGKQSQHPPPNKHAPISEREPAGAGKPR